MKRPTFAVFDIPMHLYWGSARTVTGREAILDVMKRSLGRVYTCREEDFRAVPYDAGR